MPATEHVYNQAHQQAIARVQQHLTTAQQAMALDQIIHQALAIAAAPLTAQPAQKMRATAHVCKYPAQQATAQGQHLAEAMSRSIAATQHQAAIHQQRQQHPTFICLSANKLRQITK
jgi:hypothetical protein